MHDDQIFARLTMQLLTDVFLSEWRITIGIRRVFIDGIAVLYVMEQLATLDKTCSIMHEQLCYIYIPMMRSYFRL